jgi:hypothetical protein
MSDSKSTTPEKITFPEDTRAKKEAQDPKNTYQHVTRSGHVFEMNDNAEGEHITLQHRSGSLIQFQPDGKISITTSDGMYTAVFGENRMYITGAYDIVVDGSASMKVKGDYNLTVDGNFNTTVSGDMNTVVGKNKNDTIGDDHVVIAENQSTKISNNTEHTSEGATYIGADAGVKIESTSAVVYIDAATKMELNSKSGMKLIDNSGIDLNP